MDKDSFENENFIEKMKYSEVKRLYQGAKAAVADNMVDEVRLVVESYLCSQELKGLKTEITRLNDRANSGLACNVSNCESQAREGERVKEENERLELQLKDSGETFEKWLNEVWQIVYPGKTDWDYPAQVVRHIETYVGELKSAWIPVETLPDKDGLYLVTAFDQSTGKNKTYAAEFDNGMFWLLPPISVGELWGKKHWTVDVIAWMNLPQAWEGK